MSSEVVRWITWRTKKHQLKQQQIQLQQQQRRRSNNNMHFHRYINSNCREILFKSIFYKFVFLWLVINVNVILVNGNDRALPIVSLIINDSNINYNVNNNDINRNDFNGHYTSTWAVHIPDGDIAAKRIADEHGFTYLGKVCTHFFLYTVNPEIV